MRLKASWRRWRPRPPALFAGAVRRVAPRRRGTHRRKIWKRRRRQRRRRRWRRWTTAPATGHRRGSGGGVPRRRPECHPTTRRRCSRDLLSRRPECHPTTCCRSSPDFFSRFCMARAGAAGAAGVAGAAVASAATARKASPAPRIGSHRARSRRPRPRAALCFPHLTRRRQNCCRLVAAPCQAVPFPATLPPAEASPAARSAARHPFGFRRRSNRRCRCALDVGG